jgi:hypothetical protein
MRPGRSRTESTTPFPCEQLPGREPREDPSQGTIATKCSELVCRALLDIGGPPRCALPAGAADSHKFRQVVEGCSRAVRLRLRESQNTQSPRLRFRALLIEGGDPRVQLHRA